MKQKIVTEGVWLVEETTELDSLIVKNGASLAAPEGKTLTLTVDGYGREIRPAVYQGKILITVADSHLMPFHALPEPHDFRMAVCVEDGKLNSAKSVAAIWRGGEVTDTRASGVGISSTDYAFNGIFVTGDSEYTIENCEIDFLGDGGNDFIGFGAGIMACGRAKLTVNNTKVNCRGVTRNTAFVGGDSVVTFNNCSLVTQSDGVLPPDYEECMAMGKMKRVPWLMGMRGTCRSTNLADNGYVYYNDCYVASNSWGVLSVDGSDVCRMFVKDSVIELTGASGYGAFSIGDSFDTFDHSVVRVPTYGLVMSTDNSGGEFKNGCLVESKRFGVNIFRNEGRLKINSGTVFNTGEACILCKGSNTHIEVDGASLNSANGRILQLMDNDDNGSVPTPFQVPVGETDAYVEGRDLTAADPEMDVFAVFSNMELDGDITNSTTNLLACARGVPPMPDFAAMGADMGEPGGPPPDMGRGFGNVLQGPKNLDVKFKNVKFRGLLTSALQAYRDGVDEIFFHNLEELGEVSLTPAPPVNNGVVAHFDKDCVWTVPGSCWLTSLTLEEGAVIRAPEGRTLTMTVNGVETAVAPGVYRGDIALSLK